MGNHCVCPLALLKVWKWTLAWLGEFLEMLMEWRSICRCKKNPSLMKLYFSEREIDVCIYQFCLWFILKLLIGSSGHWFLACMYSRYHGGLKLFFTLRLKIIFHYLYFVGAIFNVHAQVHPNLSLGGTKGQKLVHLNDISHRLFST